MNEHYDNTPQQAGLAEGSVGNLPMFRFADLREGIVVRAVHPDEEGNLRRTSMEYDVRDLLTGQIYNNVRCLMPAQGMDDGEETVLQAVSKTHDPSTVLRTESTSANDVDGDLVALGFLGGAHTQAIILGVLPHAKLTYGAHKVDGKRKFATHAGTSVETKADGTYEITRNVTDSTKTTIVLQSNGDLKIDHSSGALLRLLVDGTLRLDGVAADSILLGNLATEHLVKGDLFKVVYDSFVANFNELLASFLDHVHQQDGGVGPMTGGSLTGLNVAPPNPFPPPTNLPAIPGTGSSATQATPMPASNLSEKVVTE